MEADGLQDNLRRLQEAIVDLKKNYQNLSSERLLWERKISIHKEEAIQNKSKIEAMKSDLLRMIRSKHDFESEGVALSSEIQDFIRKEETGAAEMDNRQKTMLEVESKDEESLRLSQKKQQLLDIKKKVNDYESSRGDYVSLNSCDVREDCAKLSAEKKKLQDILEGKRRSITEQEKSINKSARDQDDMSKRLAAQKLRLTKQIERARKVTEDTREKTDGLRREIDELTLQTMDANVV